jgi:hypothetical protein
VTRLTLLFPALALVASAATFGYVTDLPLVAGVLCVFIALAWATNGRIEMGPYAQAVGTLTSVLLAVMLTLLLVDSDLYVRSVMYGCAIVGLSIAAFRLVQSTPRYGHRGTAVLGVIPLIVAGALPAGDGYVIGAIAWGALSIATLLLDDPSEPAMGALSRRRVGLMSVTLLTAAMLSVALAIALPPIQKWAVDRYVFGYLKPRTGFGRHFQLGTLTSIMESEEVALRTYGANPGYLRGIVYGLYRAGTWSRFGGDETTSVRVDKFNPRMEHLIRVERVGDGESDRYFAPLGAARIAADDGRVNVTPDGILYAVTDARAMQLAFQVNGASQFPVAPPTEADLEVPVELRHELRQVLADWTEPEMVPRERLMRVQSELKTTYTYALNHTRSTLQDPVIDFLLENRIGHCEFFASALALLARTARIPARVVGGYLVSERNPFGDFYTVRERDAHAWVEVWFPETGWETWDATPPGALFEVTRGEVSWLRSLFEYLAMLTDQSIERLDERDLYPILGILAVILLYMRLRAIRRTRQVRELEPDADRPLPCYEQLADYLLAFGLERGLGETLHQFAHRVRETRYGHAEELAELMLDYARFRYGKDGDEEALTRRTTELVQVA